MYVEKGACMYVKACSRTIDHTDHDKKAKSVFQKSNHVNLDVDLDCIQSVHVHTVHRYKKSIESIMRVYI